MSKKYWFGIMGMVLVVAVFVSCGGKDRGNGSTDTGRNTNSTAGPLLSGIVAKGPIQGAAITVYALNDAGDRGTVLTTATTGADGKYSVNLNSYTGNVLAVAEGGTYTDEATGATVTNAATLRAAFASVPTMVVAVTPLTEIAVQRAGTLTLANIELANTLVSNMIGGINIITTQPADVLVASSGTTAEKDYGLALAAISQMVSSGTATSVSSAISQIATDLADNKLDATGGNIAAALSTFMASANNQTGLTAATATVLQSIIDATTTPISTTVYSSADLSGTWYTAGMKTPIKNTVNPANFGYDIDQLVLNSDGSGTATSLSTSDGPTGSSAVPAGHLTIASNGDITDADNTATWHSYWFMNAGKNVMFQFFKDDVVGEQQLFFIMKKAAAYSSADLAGTWYAAGIKTPRKNTNNAANFGYDVDQVVLNSDGSGTGTSLSTSDGPTGSNAVPAGHLTIASNGDITDADNTATWHSYWYMNASKDVMYQYFNDDVTGEQQLSLFVKKAVSYSSADLMGTWYEAGIRSPIKNTNSPANFGYDVDKIIINSDGSGTVTPVATSDARPAESIPAGTVTIANDGTISWDPDSYFFMNASKDVMFQLYTNAVTGEQQLFIYLKQAQ